MTKSIILGAVLFVAGFLYGVWAFDQAEHRDARLQQFRKTHPDPYREAEL